MRIRIAAIDLVRTWFRPYLSPQKDHGKTQP